MDIQQFTDKLTPEIIEQFKTALELGKWPDGRTLSAEQKETCMQAIIAYEHQHLAEEDRTGYVPPKGGACAPEEKIKWQE